MVRTWEFFSGADCLATQRVFVKESTFKDPSETVSALAGWQQIQLEVVSITAMPIIAEEAEALNQEKAYGFSNWVPNEKKLITGLKSGEDSSAESEAGKIWEMTLKREGSNLRFARYVNDKAEPADEPDWKFTLE